MSSKQPSAEQLDVINELDKNIILFASAGTGKTFTVAKRVSRIIETGRALPEEILCLTFTIKAAGEMKDDIHEYAGEAGKNVNVSTIHSFAYQVLKEESVTDDDIYSLPLICDDVDQQEMLKELFIDGGLPADSPILENDSALREICSQVKHERELLNLYTENEEQDLQSAYRSIREKKPALFRRMTTFYCAKARGEKNIQDQGFMSFAGERIGSILYQYDCELRQDNYLDFDDLICLTHRLFRKEEKRKQWQSRYRYIFVDEMQDTTELEYDTLKQLFYGNHIMMSGDFFQTIYEWRGSNPQKILQEYEEEFRAERKMFVQNFRATRLLTNATFGYLHNTYPDLVGKYCPETIGANSTVSGDPIWHVTVSDTNSESEWLYRYLMNNRPDDPTDICIMARSNSYILKVQEGLLRIAADMPEADRFRFFTMDKDSKFFRRAVIKDIMALLSLTVNCADAVSLKRICKGFVRGVGPGTIAEIEALSQLGIDAGMLIDDDTHMYGDPYYHLIRAFSDSNVVIYDTETTGLDLEKDQIIQISAIKINSRGEIIDTLDQMVIPTVEISRDAQKTHHQTRETIIARGGIDTVSALKKFSDFVRGTVIAGHNSYRFDAPLIQRQLRENGLPPLAIDREYDTMVMAKQFYPKLKNYKLDTLCKCLGITNENAHDALGDITATGKALHAMYTRHVLPKEIGRLEAVQKYAPKFKAFYDFYTDLKVNYLQKQDLTGLVGRIITGCRIDRLSRYQGRNDQQAINDFLYAIKNSTYSDIDAFIRSFITDAALSGSQMDVLIKKLHKIPVITVHQSKGCEFRTVIIVGVYCNNFPSYMAVKDGAEAEEKRVFYVAISRAKEKLILISPSYMSTYNGMMSLAPSPYPEKIPKQYMLSVR